LSNCSLFPVLQFDDKKKEELLAKAATEDMKAGGDKSKSRVYRYSCSIKSEANRE